MPTEGRPIVELELGGDVLEAFAELIRRHDGQACAILFGAAVTGLGLNFVRDDVVSSYMIDGHGFIHLPNPDATAVDDGVPDWVREAGSDTGRV